MRYYLTFTLIVTLYTSYPYMNSIIIWLIYSLIRLDIGYVRYLHTNVVIDTNKLYIFENY